MTALGLGLWWGGYLFFTYGYVMIRGYQLTLSDLALPTHRATAIAMIQAGPPKASTSSAPGPTVTTGAGQKLPAAGTTGTYRGSPLSQTPKGAHPGR